ncbi:MAG: hypothetical protein ABIJ48_06305 [Actinomycetota bacterium]
MSSPIPPTEYSWDPDRPDPLAGMWEDPDQPDIVHVDMSGPWLVRLDWGEIEGRVECVGFSIRHQTRSQPITTGLLRQFNLASQVLRWRRQMHFEAGANLEFPISDQARGYYERQLALSGKKRHRYSPEHFESVAREYTRAYQNGEHPTSAVADYFTTQFRYPVSRSAAAKWVMTCRQTGLLPATEPRKPNA